MILIKQFLNDHYTLKVILIYTIGLGLLFSSYLISLIFGLLIAKVIEFYEYFRNSRNHNSGDNNHDGSVASSD